MRRLVLIPLLLALLGLFGPAPAPAAAAPPDKADWSDRSGVDIQLPSGWRIRACEGDAPVLCGHNPAGTVAGTLVLNVGDLAAGDDISRNAVAREVDEFHRIFSEDRRTTCGPSYQYVGDPLQDATVGGRPGYRFGFTLRNSAGAITEQAVIHLGFDAGRRFSINTSFTDPAGCPGSDPDRIEFPVSARNDILPYLDRLAAESILPVDFAVGPACAAARTADVRFTDIAGNPHQRLIECLAALGVAKGETATTYRPARAVTRAQLASLAARTVELFGERLPEPDRPRFRDLDGNPHRRRIEQLAEAGVVKGTSATTFDPNRAATRAEATAVVVAIHELILAAGLYDEGVAFDDVSGTHAAAISRAATAGIVRGTSAGTFEPDRTVRRDEIAALLGRAVNRMSWLRTPAPPAEPAPPGPPAQG